MSKPILGVDCDEVICYMMKSYVPFYNKTTGSNVKYEDVTSFDLKKHFHTDEEAGMDAFVQFAKYEAQKLSIVEQAKECLIELSKKFRIILVTGRQEALWRESTEFWVNNHLNGVPVEKLIFANDYAFDNTIHADKPIKGIICENEGIDIFVDDRERYVLECLPYTKKCILFGDYPWTDHSIVDEKVVYCKTWGDVVKDLMG